MNKFLRLIILSSFLVVLLSSFVSAQNQMSAVVGIDVLGIIIALVVLVFMLSMLKAFSDGDLKSSFIFIIAGIAAQLLALVYTLLFVRFKLAPVPVEINIHHILMIIGFILFSIAAYKLRQVVKKFI